MVIHDTIGCTACHLGKTKLPRCRGFGPEDAEIAIVGINPSVRAHNGTLGCFLIPYLARKQNPKLPGTTRAFYHLAMLAGLNLRNVYSTNAVKCATKDNADPTVVEMTTCRDVHLLQELRTMSRLTTVICMGRRSGASLGLKNFGDRARVPGTKATAVLLRHPNATLRRWTILRHEAEALRRAISGLGNPYSRTPTLRR